jgi:hypothetical protein
MRTQIYDLGRYLCESESGEEPYLVDVLGEGQCDCADYRIRVDALEQKPACKHLVHCRQQFTRDFPPEVRTAILSQQKKP